jgi:hypothetical protein
MFHSGRAEFLIILQNMTPQQLLKQLPVINSKQIKGLKHKTIMSKVSGKTSIFN